MTKLRQTAITALMNFSRWPHSPQIWLSFGLGFIACFLMSQKVVDFAARQDTLLQLFEPFLWTFGDANSILLISLCLLLLFGDMPNLGNEAPLFLVRTSRFCWMAGQLLYLTLATTLFVLFILLSTCVLCGARAFSGNMWSETAAILGYSGIGESIAVPAFVKVLELTLPYQCTLHIFGLMLGYSLVLSALIFFFNLLKGKRGMLAGAAFSGFGFFLTPQVVTDWFRLGPTESRIANILFGWLSPLNHATYYMHNFGYDNLPRLGDSYLVFGAASLAVYLLAFWRVRKYSFNFTGTER
ncbi:hypothetical protein I5Q82_14020 [Acutalibacter muris]|uniref:ABC transporter permease n=1 Tax=Acutalibacter muris TaxID=1796620 RepID=A0A1Z2XN72_9FIRM|nr:hypothetical protein [Acutalibacter muris]ANU53450.1 hypothetical protein A4V00_05025 [Hungateiclostridiaceae bacterium KB18]ASB39874.1 hypothetical protein ADH66_03955 [Acutalibacter muris]QQR29163.1 hypothetical protein I5Q82_14020 [Acutalibacter muris]